MNTSTNPKNQNSTFTSVPAPPGAVPFAAPRKPRPGFRRIVVGWKAVPMHADLVDGIEIAEHRERGDGDWRPRAGTRCLKCFLKEPKAGHFCRWDAKDSYHHPQKRVVYTPIFRWVPG